MPPVPEPSLVSFLSTERKLVEDPAIELIETLGWETASLFHEAPGPNNPTGRQSFKDAVLPKRLWAALWKLNPDLPDVALQAAADALTQDRSAMLPVAANRELASLLRDGVSVELRQDDGSTKPVRVILINWTDPQANDFFLASQVWVESDLYKRRPDLAGFVNGIPLLLLELKAPQEKLSEAYDKNLSDYRDTIPRFLHPNGFVILSNGHEAVMGSSHAEFEEFAAWKKLDEAEPDQAGLEIMLRATCERTRFLDLVENFVLFEEAKGGLRRAKQESG